MKIIGIIPARFASTRFPGKPLIEINGKTMLQRVYEQTMQAKQLSEVLIATDDEKIAQHAQSFGAKVVLTKADHPSGTDRCYEAYVNFGETFDYVVNIQGDEPFLDPQQIDELAAICDGKTELATQMIAVDNESVLFDQGEVKIVMNQNKEALYFSRMVIPFIKNVPQEDWHKHHPYFRHVGMYAYRTDILEALTKLPPSSLENAESLEQLRWLENGFKIKLVQTEFDSHCIDTPDDIEKVLNLLSKK
ncbi:MAG: 3-deoxy-manno-octulosonate cytidylyltransferase [Bacteroidia bacterium]|nr:3-deoxy-manno-octulosonate cytidylyltransferase [Bacteroidia bacterium]MCF8425346.1 3-deoxy-manno-octulosonate cytidylyltransferase [Bacteroidia bacterium]MCF8446871.1 3-deoxy-manno-octulosonate cytidylyltransferase [Bacteroidia bacterium]